MIYLRINKNFSDILPPLTDSQYNDLEVSIKDEGVREPLIVWNDYIVDGHNRYIIAQKHNISFKTISKEFKDENEAKIWIINNQKARRNLTDGWQFELAEKKKELLLEKGKENISEAQKERHSGVSLPKTGKVRNHNTRKELAKELGWSKGKVSQADYLWKHGDNETKEKTKTGDWSINQAYKKTKKIKTKQDREDKAKQYAEEGKSKKTKTELYLGDFEKVLSHIEDNSIHAIITDPPYPYEYIEEWTKLAKFAKRVLVDNGFCIAYSGQMYLGEVMNRMGEYLDYYWTFGLNLTQHQLVNGRNIYCNWKPILIYQNKFKKIDFPIDDFIRNDKREKQFHEWQQGEDGVKPIIENFTIENGKILDPFMGTGSFLITGLKLNRFVIGAEENETTYNIAKNRINKYESKK